MLHEIWRGTCDKAMELQDKGNGFKQKESRGIGHQQEVLAVSVVRHCTRLPGEAVDVPSVELGPAEATPQVLCSVLGPSQGH